MSRREKMNGYFAVFNGHINDAHRRAVRAFNAKFGRGSWKSSGMAEVKRTGIMAIFETSPTVFTQFYVDRVTKYVNEDRR